MATSLTRPTPCIPRFLLMLMVLSAAAAGPLRGQDGVMSASLLRVLAEVADEYRTGERVYLVAQHRQPHIVAGAFTSLTQAKDIQRDSGAAYGVFGPYLTPRDPVRDTSTRVTAITITFQTPRGTRTRRVDPEVDALFLSPSSIDKFLLPYYARLYGLEYARKLRLQVAPPSEVSCHRKSTPCTETPEGIRQIQIR